MNNPTNRFYYSEEQATLFGENDANEVFNGKEWVKYSEWISKEFTREISNWEDGVLVFETEEDNPPIKVSEVKNRMFDEMMQDEQYLNFEEEQNE